MIPVQKATSSIESYPWHNKRLFRFLSFVRELSVFANLFYMDQ